MEFPIIEKKEALIGDKIQKSVVLDQGQKRTVFYRKPNNEFIIRQYDDKEFFVDSDPIPIEYFEKFINVMLNHFGSTNESRK